MLKNDKTHIRLERHEITQEDFTPVHIVEDMISRLTDDVFLIPSKTVLDNSCGIGNFLVEILNRKLSNCKTLDDAKSAVRSIYGVELMADNVEECRNRLYETFIKHFPNLDENENFKLRQVIRNRIQWCDALVFNYNKWPELSLRNPDEKHMNIGFHENCPSWNDKYPMWVKKPEIEEIPLW